MRHDCAENRRWYVPPRRVRKTTPTVVKCLFHDRLEVSIVRNASSGARNGWSGGHGKSRWRTEANFSLILDVSSLLFYLLLILSLCSMTARYGCIKFSELEPVSATSGSYWIENMRHKTQNKGSWKYSPWFARILSGSRPDIFQLLQPTTTYLGNTSTCWTQS